ncbi:MAG: 50S ribosomal protein L19 [Chlamydiales bacterium]|nr:50S ribosomal protein L19 [Chlamydiales bacterium]
MDAIIDDYDSEQLKKDVPEFHVGDTVRVSTRIIEGEKERIQVFQGTVIARKGKGLSETFSLHRVSYGEGMERVFYLHSPRITQIQVVKKGDVKRAKLYYLRGATGKAAKVKEKIGARPKKQHAKRAIDNEETVTTTEEPIIAHEEEIQEPVESTSQE